MNKTHDESYFEHNKDMWVICYNNERRKAIEVIYLDGYADSFFKLLQYLKDNNKIAYKPNKCQEYIDNINDIDNLPVLGITDV